MNAIFIELNIPLSVYNVLNILKENGFEAFIVGGCMRDSLIGRQPQDWDIATNSIPSNTIQIFNKYKKTFRVLETGIKYGTLGLYHFKTSKLIEVTTYRLDSTYQDSRRPDSVTFVDNLKYDLSRRDFSFNAIAGLVMNQKNEAIDNKVLCKVKVYDYFNGLKDLKNKTITCVGNPINRLSEDALRIMRCIRFASIMPHYFCIDSHTNTAVFLLKDKLKNISKERLNAEFSKLLLGDYAYKILLLYQGVIKIIFPLLHTITLNKYYSNCKAIRDSIKSLPIRFCILFDYIIEQSYFTMILDSLKTLKYDKKTIKAISNILEIESLYNNNKIKDKNHIKNILRTFGENSFQNWICFKKQFDRNVYKIEFLFKDILENQECFMLKHLPINGLEIQCILHKNGIYNNNKNIGRILKKLLQHAIYNNLSYKDNDLKDKLLKVVHSFIK